MSTNNKVAKPQEVDEPEEIEVGDGSLTLEPPAEDATFENPPNGGKRAWLIVFSCAVIQALLSSLELLIKVSILDVEMSSATGVDPETQWDIYSQYVELANIYAPLGAFVMIFLGYQATICIGAGIVMVTVIILSFLENDTEDVLKFLLYGPAAIGTGFMKLSVLIPVLEYFTTKRIKALFLSRLGIYIGRIIFIVAVKLSSYHGNWRDSLRGCTGLCMGIGLVGLTLQQLKLKLKDGTGTFIEKTLGLGKKAIFKNVLFWSTCVVYFFYQWGIETTQGQFLNSDITGKLGIDGNLAKAYLYALSSTIGLFLGMFLAWMFKKMAYEEESRLHVKTLKADRLNIAFGILALSAFLMAICCFIAPMAVNWYYFFLFSLLFGASFAFCEGLRDDAVPEEFGRDNVRIVEGLILMFAGLGGIITNEITGGIEGDGDEDDQEGIWKKIFNYGGGMLLVSSVVTLLVLLLKERKMLLSRFTGTPVVPIRDENLQKSKNT